MPFHPNVGDAVEIGGAERTRACLEPSAGEGEQR